MQSLKIIVEELQYLPVQVVARVATVDAVVTVGVNVHLEVFVGLHKRFSVLKYVLRMNIVVGKTVAQQQRAVQLAGTFHRVNVVT